MDSSSEEEVVSESIESIRLTPDGQPAIKFLKQLRVFNPKKVPYLPQKLDEYESIPGMGTVPASEFAIYLNLATELMNLEGFSHKDICAYWKSISDRVPSLAQVALTYVNCPISSADAERSFSLYNILLDARRRSLSEQSIRSLLFLYCNQKLQ